MTELGFTVSNLVVNKSLYLQALQVKMKCETFSQINIGYTYKCWWKWKRYITKHSTMVEGLIQEKIFRNSTIKPAYFN